MKVTDEAAKEVEQIIALAGRWVTMLRDDGAYKRRKLYNLSEHEWLEQVAVVMQNLMGAAADSVAIGHFLQQVDAELAEKGTLSAGLATIMWDDYRHGVAMEMKTRRNEQHGNSKAEKEKADGRGAEASASETVSGERDVERAADSGAGAAGDVGERAAGL